MIVGVGCTKGAITDFIYMVIAQIEQTDRLLSGASIKGIVVDFLQACFLRGQVQMIQPDQRVKDSTWDVLQVVVSQIELG